MYALLCIVLCATQIGFITCPPGHDHDSTCVSLKTKCEYMYYLSTACLFPFSHSSDNGFFLNVLHEYCEENSENITECCILHFVTHAPFAVWSW